MEALYNIPSAKGVKCTLCPHNCLITEGKTGNCKVRRNVNGKLIAETWGYLSAVHLDPIEKKPLYHFFPGRQILSLGSVGCNMHCRCCQNWQISQVPVPGDGVSDFTGPNVVVRKVLSVSGNIGVAYTYNEPTVWYEYMLETARLVRQAGLKNVMVSNGYINAGPLQELLEYIDAFNIDLKGFTDKFYREYTGARLEPALQTLQQIKKANRHLEITNLVIPTQNDDIAVFRKMISWIATELGTDTVLHLSRYHPAFRSGEASTSAATLENFCHIAHEKLHFVYAGNIHLEAFHDTYCPVCGNLLVSRTGYDVTVQSLTPGGACKRCGKNVISC
jgi:pyruvate formate lyase activating enzyme